MQHTVIAICINIILAISLVSTTSATEASAQAAASPPTAPAGPEQGALLPSSGPTEQASQERKSEHLDEVVVTATRTERKSEEVPAGVTTISPEDIKNTKMFGLSEALQGASGVQSETKNGGYDARLIIRGAGLKARYGVREIMVLVDGIPITDPDGFTRLDSVDTSLVDRIDVVKGPNSTLYGANSAGGVINIITKSPFEETTSVKAGYGSDNTQMYSAVYGKGFGSTSVSLYGSRKSTDSWRAWNEFSSTQAGLKMGHLVDATTSIEASFNFTKADLQLPGALTKDQFEADITQPTTEQWRHMGRYSDVYSASVKYTARREAWELKPLLYYQHWTHYHPVTGLINDGGADILGTDIQGDRKHRIGGMDGVFTVGVAGQADRRNSERYIYRDVQLSGTGRILYTLSDVAGMLAEEGSDDVTKWGVYAQESLRPTDRWIIDAGARYDHVHFDIHNQIYQEYSYALGRYVANTATEDVSKNFSALTPRLGIVYKASSIVHVYGNVSAGFQTPQSSEITENPDLKPLTAYNYETGLKARFEKGHNVDLSVFRIDVKDEIVQTALPGNQTTYSNAGKTEKTGVEAAGSFIPVKGAEIGGSYTYSHFKYKDFTEPVSGTNYDRSGSWLPYVPWHQYSIFGMYRHASGFKVRLDTNTWGRYYIDNANSALYDGYQFVTNGLIGYEKDGLNVSFDVYNIFDKRYAMEVTKEATSTTEKYRPGAPRSWLVRMSYAF